MIPPITVDPLAIVATLRRSCNEKDKPRRQTITRQQRRQNAPPAPPPDHNPRAPGAINGRHFDRSGLPLRRARKQKHTTNPPRPHTPIHPCLAHRTSFFPTGRAKLLISSMIIPDAARIPCRNSTGLAPEVTSRIPWFTISWVSSVDVVVPSPALQTKPTGFFSSAFAREGFDRKPRNYQRVSF